MNRKCYRNERENKYLDMFSFITNVKYSAHNIFAIFKAKANEFVLQARYSCLAWL